jgi:prepilin-type N-terminal cleavage/methylation domain-containing protein
MTRKAFSLIELLVVIAIIAILTSVAVVGLTSVRQKAADTKRLADFKEIQIGLETYKSVNNVYPDPGTPGSDAYITGLMPNFISKLPKDPTNQHTVSKGYNYRATTDRKGYCLYILGTVYKPTSQSDLNYASIANSWYKCDGNATPATATP